MNANYDIIDSPAEITRDEDGVIESIYIRVRTGRVVRTVQPNPKYLVYFELGPDDLPVGIRAYEPTPGLNAVTLVWEFFITTHDGKPVGMGASVDHFLVSEDELKILMQAAGAMKALTKAAETASVA